MYAIYYYNPCTNEPQPTLIYVGCDAQGTPGTYAHEHDAIEAAKGFARRHPCYPRPNSPATFVVVKMIGRAERSDVIWMPYSQF